MTKKDEDENKKGTKKKVVKKKTAKKKPKVKKKKSTKKRKWVKPLNTKLYNGEYYRILLTSQKKIFTNIYSTYIKEYALKAYDKLLKENKKNVRFPVKYSSRDHNLVKANYELLLLKRKNNPDDSSEVLLRNGIGQLVPHTTNSNRTIIFRKETFLFEESFWVYGFDPRHERKNFDYILNKILLKGLFNVKYPMKTVVLLFNKLIIQTDDDFDIVICKCVDDAVRLYNELEIEIKKKKLKSVFFAGSAKYTLKKRLIEAIIEKTGWDYLKITRNSTRP